MSTLDAVRMKNILTHMRTHRLPSLSPHPDGLVETFDAGVQGMYPTFTLLKVLSCRRSRQVSLIELSNMQRIITTELNGSYAVDAMEPVPWKW